MVSGFAAVAQVPGAISALCAQKGLSTVGRYEVRLFHPLKEEWTSVVVDDRLPTRTYGDAHGLQVGVGVRG